MTEKSKKSLVNKAALWNIFDEEVDESKKVLVEIENIVILVKLY